MNEMNETSYIRPPIVDEIWQILREVSEQSKETDRKFQETEMQIQALKQMFQETDRKFLETDRKFLETDRKFQDTDRKFQDTDRKFQETDRKFLETDRKFQDLHKSIGELGGRLGEFVEGLVAPALLRVFQARGIPVYGLSRDISRSNPSKELATQIDLFAVNGEACVLVEVKSKCGVDDVNDHLERMDKFKPLFPEYADKKAYGAMAAMVIPDDVAKYAYRKGFFVLAQQGENVVLLNDEKFKPSAW